MPMRIAVVTSCIVVLQATLSDATKSSAPMSAIERSSGNAPISGRMRTSSLYSSPKMWMNSGASSAIAAQAKKP